MCVDFDIALDCEPEMFAGINTAEGSVEYFASRECYDYLAETSLDPEAMISFDEHVALIGIVRETMMSEAHKYFNN